MQNKYREIDYFALINTHAVFQLLNHKANQAWESRESILS